MDGALGTWDPCCNGPSLGWRDEWGRTMTMSSACRKVAAFGMLMAPIGLMATMASADPAGSKNSFSFPASCSNGVTVQDLQVVVNSANGQGSGTQNNPKGQAVFTPAHVVGSNLVFHPG